jgi:dihydrofolate reductase
MNIVYIAVSLDGYIAGPDGDIKWLNTIPNENNSDHGFGEFIDSIDGIVMGRKTYEKVLEFNEWPYDKPVYVLTNTLDILSVELKNKAKIVSGKLKDILKDLNSRGLENLYIDGGVTIQSFLKEDLIDEMIISYVSLILGEGIPLFGEIKNQLNFKCEKIEYISPHLVKHWYKRVR